MTAVLLVEPSHKRLQNGLETGSIMHKFKLLSSVRSVYWRRCLG
jgi:hypothetical protein